MGLFGTDFGPDIKIGGGDNGLLGQVGEGIQRPFKEAGKFLGLIPGDQPQLQNVPIPSELQDQIKNQQSRAISPDAYSQQLLQGTGDAGKAVGFDPTSQALSARARRAFQSGAGDLQRQASLQGYQTEIPKMSRAAGLDITLNNIARGVQTQALQTQMAADMARSNALSSALGGIGAGAGGIAGLAKAGVFSGGSGGGGSGMNYIPGWQNMFQPAQTYGLGTNTQF